MLEDEGLLGLTIVDITQSHLVSEWRTWCAIACHLDAVSTQNLFCARYASLAAARTHTHAGGVLELVYRDIFAVANYGEQCLHIHILAVANECLALLGIGKRTQVQWLGITLLKDEAIHLVQVVNLSGFDTCHIGLIVLLEHFLDGAFAHLGSVVINQEHLFALFYLIFYWQEHYILALVVAQNCQARTMVHTLHTAYTLVVINHWHRRCGWLADSALWT